MIRNFARPGAGLLILLTVVTACAAPASPATTAPVANPPVVVETAAAPVAATATGVPEPTSTQQAAATEQPAEPTPLLVETPVKAVAAAESQAVEEATVYESAGPTDEQQWVLDGLPSLGPAPELRNDVWLNSEPLRLAELRGKVVLLDMWTFG